MNTIFRQTFHIQCMVLPTHKLLYSSFNYQVIGELDKPFGREQARNMASLSGSGISMRYHTSFLNSV